MKKLGRVMKQMTLLRLINSFLTNYRNEEAILRNGSSFVFESVDLLSYHIHKTREKKRKMIDKIF